MIIIEDKTNTKQHSGQLKRYKKIAEEWCFEQKTYESPICIYLKTGNESKQSLKKVEENGFAIYNRLDFIQLLNTYQIKNDIYDDFKSRLNRIEEANHQWEKKLIKNWKGNDWQGFYQYLEEEIGLIGWDYVNNANGGFWNAVINWSYWGIYPAYIQTEEDKLCFKISTDPASVKLPENTKIEKIRNELSGLILKSAKDKNLQMIRRPNRFGYGKYMTVAVVDCENWLGNKNEFIKIKEVSNRIEKFKFFLQETIK